MQLAFAISAESRQRGKIIAKNLFWRQGYYSKKKPADGQAGFRVNVKQ